MRHALGSLLKAVWRILFFILAFPFFLPVFLGGGLLMAYSFVSIYVHGIFKARRMAKVGRYLKPNEARTKVRNGEGILIIELLSLGMGGVSIWWSPDTHYEPPTIWMGEGDPVGPNDAINYDRLISPTTGSALLVETLLFSPTRYLKKRFGVDKNQCLPIWSAAVLVERRRKEK